MNYCDISVIIPVYNCENYIDRCISSIQDQDLVPRQIILINDGSTDNSAKICDKLKERYDNILVIHSENKGVSHARNLGLDHATEELITFIDADDWVLPGYFSRICTAMKEPNINFYQTSFQKTNGIIKPTLNPKTKPIQINTLTDTTWNYNVCIGGAVIRHDLLKKTNLRFIEGLKLAEDQIFIFTYLAECNEAIFADNKDYCYFINPQSATRNINYSEVLNSIHHLNNISLSCHKYQERYDLTILSQLRLLSNSKIMADNIDSLSKIFYRLQIPIKYGWYNTSGISLRLLLILNKICPSFGLKIFQLAIKYI